MGFATRISIIFLVHIIYYLEYLHNFLLKFIHIEAFFSYSGYIHNIILGIFLVHIVGIFPDELKSDEKIKQLYPIGSPRRNRPEPHWFENNIK